MDKHSTRSSAEGTGVRSGIRPGSLGGAVKFNLHLLEHCNYRCAHCFAKFQCRRSLRLDSWKRIVDNCSRAFPGCSFNLAGGEPLMVRFFHDLVCYCRDLGHRVSVISNGYLMTDQWIRENVPLLDTVGLSLDSFDPDTMRRLGRCTASGGLLTRERIRRIMSLIRDVNPLCRIKVNTVVSSLNKDEILGGEISSLPVSRWKILKMMRFDNGDFSNCHLGISLEEYAAFVRRNVGGAEIRSDSTVMRQLEGGCHAVIETTLRGGYLMIDANGCLVDDTVNTSYVPAADCLREDVRRGLERLGFDRELYLSRYSDMSTAAVAV